MTVPKISAVTSDDQRREDAVLYVQQLRVFRTHAAVFAASIVLIFVANLAVNLAAGLTGHWAWWSAWAVLAGDWG